MPITVPPDCLEKIPSRKFFAGSNFDFLMVPVLIPFYISPGEYLPISLKPLNDWGGIDI
jgi:hypothetical protein